MEYTTKTFTIDAWPVGSVTEDDVPEELEVYVEGHRLIFLSGGLQVVNVTGTALPEDGDYLVLEDHNLYFINAEELDVMFENLDGTPILPEATFYPRERRTVTLAKAKLAEKKAKEAEKEEEKEVEKVPSDKKVEDKVEEPKVEDKPKTSLLKKK